VTGARGKPIWYHLRHNKWEATAAMVKRAGEGRLSRGGGDVDASNSGSNQETLFRLRPTTTRDCSGCHDRSSMTKLAP